MRYARYILERRTVVEDSPSPFRTEVAAIKARYRDIELDLRFLPQELVIEWIENTSENPGTAGRALKEICEAADRHSIPISLEVAEGDPGLIRYYQKFDFEIERRPGDDHVYMRRLPTLMRMMRR